MLRIVSSLYKSKRGQATVVKFSDSGPNYTGSAAPAAQWSQAVAALKQTLIAAGGHTTFTLV